MNEKRIEWARSTANDWRKVTGRLVRRARYFVDLDTGLAYCTFSGVFAPGAYGADPHDARTRWPSPCRTAPC